MENKVVSDKKITGWNYLNLAMLAFAGLGIEVLLAYFLEPILYGAKMLDWSASQRISHWIIICISWGIASYLLIGKSKNKYDFNIFQKGDNMKTWQWLTVIFSVVLSLVITYKSWEEFKVIKEFKNLGILSFTFQYIYYAFETVLFMLIIIFSQKAFEVWFKKSNIPYGGIICGLTWGLAHAFTKGSLAVGIIIMLLGFLFGGAYLLVNRDIKKTYLVLFLMFIL